MNVTKQKVVHCRLRQGNIDGEIDFYFGSVKALCDSIPYDLRHISTGALCDALRYAGGRYANKYIECHIGYLVTASQKTK